MHSQGVLIKLKNNYLELIIWFHLTQPLGMMAGSMGSTVHRPGGAEDLLQINVVVD